MCRARLPEFNLEILRTIAKEKEDTMTSKSEITFQRSPGLFDELRQDMESMLPWLNLDRPRRRLARRLESWVPTTDIFEQKGELILKVDLPGMQKGDVEVLIEEGDLVLKGERKIATDVKEEAYYRCERDYGMFYRRFALPFAADPARIVAKFTDGVLEVKLPIPVEHKAEPQKIAVM